jgi:protein-L-isoaspartate(D-aspartate) O-methyltransferase
MLSIDAFGHSIQARRLLVEGLRQDEAIQSESVAQAFLSIPREAFVSSFFEKEEFVWIVHTPDGYTPDAWIDAIYRDAPLVTLIDERNFPASSSSAPAAMAMMLEALMVQPGMRVLEISTGTGYNAAMLAYLVGDPALVTTIDMEESLARSAQQVLEAIIGPVRVQVGDGYNGVPLHAPYDRIIATASASTIPAAWYEQLAPDGCLVMILQGSLQKTSFLVIEKQADGRATGRFDPRYLYFIPMRSASRATNPVRRLLQQPPVQRIVQENNEKATDLFENAAFHWFLQWAVPGITMRKAKMKAKDGETLIPFVTIVNGQESTIVQPYLQGSVWSGYERGHGGLWETVLQVYQEWVSIGRPDQSAYHVEWNQQHARFQLFCEHGTGVLPLKCFT